MNAIRDGDCVSGTDFYAASAGNAFLDTDSRFSFSHGKTPFVFSLVYRGKMIYSVIKSHYFAASFVSGKSVIAQCNERPDSWENILLCHVK